MADREGLLDQFCRLTGAPRDRGRFFLEASSWKLQVTKYSSLYVCVCVCVWSGLSHSHEVRATPYALTLRLVLRL